jgi:hypothetical protein
MTVSTVASVTAVAHDGKVNLFSEIVTFCMDSDGDKLYLKLVAFDEIGNFVVQTFFTLKSSVAKKI